MNPMYPDMFERPRSDNEKKPGPLRRAIRLVGRVVLGGSNYTDIPDELAIYSELRMYEGVARKAVEEFGEGQTGSGVGPPPIESQRSAVSGGGAVESIGYADLAPDTVAEEQVKGGGITMSSPTVGGDAVGGDASALPVPVSIRDRGNLTDGLDTVLSKDGYPKEPGTLVGFTGVRIRNTAKNSESLGARAAADQDPPAPDLAEAIEAAARSSYFLEPLSHPADRRRSNMAHEHRYARLLSVRNAGGFPPNPLGDPNFDIYSEDTRARSRQLMLPGERHRELTPLLAARYRSESTREDMMHAFDEAARQNTRELIAKVRSGERLDYDVIVKGGGEYAAATVQHMRELAPDLRILVVEMTDELGGQFGSYGPFPAFRKNSRSRPGRRLLPYIPRTKGDINSHGPYGLFCTPDLDDGIYAPNTVRGDLNKMSVYMAATDVMVGTRQDSYLKLRNGRFNVALQSRDEQGEVDFDATTSVIIDARGLRQRSAISTPQGDSVKTRKNGYYTTADAYRHFGGKYTPEGAVHDPMAAFDNKVVEIDAFADGGKTLAELLVRAMTSETYGPRRRQGPRQINIVNAPGKYRDDIVATLRSRYSGSFPQSFAKSRGDPGGLLVPYMGKAVEQWFVNGEWQTRLEGGYLLPADVKFDTTNNLSKFDPDDTPGVLSVSPAFQRTVPPEVRELCDALLIGDNVDALWYNVPGALAQAEEGIAIVRAMQNGV